MKERKNYKIIILVVILIVFVFVIGVIISLQKGLLKNNNNIINNVDNNLNNNEVENIDNSDDDNIIINNIIKDEYAFGDSITLNILSEVEGLYTRNFSKWHVINDTGDYVVLLSDLIFDKNSPEEVQSIDFYSRYKQIFTDKGIIFGEYGELRAISRNDLETIFGCNIESLVCTNLPTWEMNDGYSYQILTNASDINGMPIVIQDGKLIALSTNDILAYVHPVMIMLQQNIK